MIIEIGTSDFNTNAGKVDGIFIEPVKFYYDRLPDCKKENVAISNVEGELDMFSLTEPQIKEYKLPNWIRGCSSLAKMHPTMAKELKKRGLSQDIVNVDKVPVVRIKSIIEKYGLEEIDYLKVDTEGHDCVIINDLLDTVDIKPKKIKFENNVLSAKADVKLLVERLKHDYDIKYLKNDIECYLKQ